MPPHAKIAIATCRGNALAQRADAPLVREFEAINVQATRVGWDDESAAWSDFDGILIRSTWDWHLAPQRFLSWLASIDKTSRVWNPPSLVAWSLDKRCLIDLDSRGVRSVPTVSIADIRTFASPWPEWVVKPAFGATAYRTSLIRSDRDFAEWRRQNDDFDGPLVAQPFQNSVLSHGERSLIFIGNTFSHAVRKFSKAGDFRVQAEFGGGAEPVTCNVAEKDLAERCLRSLGKPTAFARIDLINDAAGSPMVIECEVAEPELFFGHCPDAAAKLAKTIADDLSGSI